MSSSSKRPRTDSGPSGDKRQKTLALPPIPLPLIMKEDLAAARLRQGYAKSAESQSPPCIAVLYTKIKGRMSGKKWIKMSFVKSGVSITFGSRLEASRVFGGMPTSTISININKKCKSEIQKGIHKGQYVMFSNIVVEPIMFGDIEINPAPAKSERVKGHHYVINAEVRIWGGSNWYCVQHEKRLSKCGFCGGASICDCGINRSQCRICRVQPLLECTKCPQTCRSSIELENHMRTHTDEKPFKCNHKRCSFRSASKGSLTRHKGQLHDIGNEQCTICYDNCYRPRSWIDGNSKEEVNCCRTCDREFNGESVRVEYDWSDCLDEHFHPEFRLCTNTQVNSCNKSRPDALYAVPALILPALILHGECDENQHQGKLYSCEEKRISELYDQFCGMQYIVVRVNPDAYTHPDGRDKPEWEMRKVLMLKVMKACLTKKWDTMIHVVYMFYSENNPNITRNFSKTMLYDAEDVDEFCKN